MEEYQLVGLTTPDTKGRRKLNWDSFAKATDPAFRRLYSLDSRIRLHLDGVDLIGHDALMWTLSLAAWRQFQGLPRTYFMLPNNGGQLALLGRLRFVQAWEAAGGEVWNPHYLWSGSIDQAFPDSLRYFQLLARGSWSTVATSIGQHFARDLAFLFRDSIKDVSLAVQSPFLHSLHELVHNVAIHGGPERGDGIGFACYRAMPFPVLRFCATDLGPGFKSTLGDQGVKAKDDSDAVATGLIWRKLRPEDGVFGLYHALGFIRQIGGTLQIRSGGVLRTMRLESAGQLRRFDEGYDSPSVEWVDSIAQTIRVPPLMGTHVCLDLRVPQSSRHRRRGA